MCIQKCDCSSVNDRNDQEYVKMGSVMNLWQKKDVGKISSSLWDFQDFPDRINGNKATLRRDTKRHISTHFSMRYG